MRSLARPRLESKMTHAEDAMYEGITFVQHCAARNFWDMEQGEYCRQPVGHDGDHVWEW